MGHSFSQRCAQANPAEAVGIETLVTIPAQAVYRPGLGFAAIMVVGVVMAAGWVV